MTDMIYVVAFPLVSFCKKVLLKLNKMCSQKEKTNYIELTYIFCWRLML